MTAPYRACSCRAPSTTGPDGRKKPGKLLGKQCPELVKKGHGAWYARYEAPPGADGKRRQPRIGPFPTEKATKAALAAATAGAASGRPTDHKTRVGDYLDRWLSWRETEVKASTFASYRQAFDLYWKPGIGHMKLSGLRESDIRDALAAARKLNTPAEATDRSEMLRRLAAARFSSHGRRRRRLPLSEARLRRITAPLVAALNDCKSLSDNPAAGIGWKVRRAKPLVWTDARVAEWRRTGKRPAVVMVWRRDQAEQFLRAIEDDRLRALFHLAVTYGPRRGELAQLPWSDLDLATRRIHLRGDVKSEDSDRAFTLDEDTAAVFEAWHERQLFEQLEWGTAWVNSGLVFTREDGSPLRDEWISEHFASLTKRADLPPLRFHDLRHTALTVMRALGVPIKMISHIAGHARVSFTDEFYVEVAAEMEADAAARIGAAYQRQPDKIIAD